MPSPSLVPTSQWRLRHDIHVVPWAQTRKAGTWYGHHCANPQFYPNNKAPFRAPTKKLGVSEDKQMDKETALLAMYKSQVSRSEHFERIRATLSTLLLAIAAALVGFWTSIDEWRWLPSVTIILIGAFGVIATIKHSSRAKRHGQCAAAFRRQLYDVFPAIQQAYEDGSIDRTPTGLNRVWRNLHVMVISLGVLLLAISGVDA